jgi:hypothetical protein
MREVGRKVLKQRSRKLGNRMPQREKRALKKVYFDEYFKNKILKVIVICSTIH